MQIIIPMSGFGERFIKVGYSIPKPLIEVDEMPIIQHVVNLFPDEDNFIFICNSTHLKETNMREVLKKIAPSSKIIEISPHKKGPVYAVEQIFDYINDEEEVIVNYCDFSCYWNYKDFLETIRKENADGAIAAYKGFHPHMLGTTNYAFIKDTNNWLEEIQEKKPYTDNRMQEFASDGTYYFKKGIYVKKYFKQLIVQDINTNGEYYVSMVYNLLKKAGLNTYIYEIEHMLQWGTPEDLNEYTKWSECFKKLCQTYEFPYLGENSIALMPMAGKGERFSKEGYNLPKPFIPVSGNPMFLQAINSLPSASKQIFVVLEEFFDKFNQLCKIKEIYPNSKVVNINTVTEGQACTCKLGLDGINLESPLLIGACDCMILYNSKALQDILDKSDVVLFTFKNHYLSTVNPFMYGWVKTDTDGNVINVSVKVPISDNPQNDHAVTGIFFFKKAEYFLYGLEYIKHNNIRVNNEFYVDSTINSLVEKGLSVKVFEVDDYICLGTPDDLRTFEYWQDFFHKCDWHCYSREKDYFFAG